MKNELCTGILSSRGPKPQQHVFIFSTGFLGASPYEINRLKKIDNAKTREYCLLETNHTT